MKSGNAILAVFFWYMAVELPIRVYELIIQHNLQEYLPLKPASISAIIFGASLILGCIALVTGSNIKIRTAQHSIEEQSTEDKVDDIFSEENER